MIKQNSKVYRLFEKRIKDLTPEEYREYNRVTHKAWIDKFKKEGNQSKWCQWFAKPYTEITKDDRKAYTALLNLRSKKKLQDENDYLRKELKKQKSFLIKSFKDIVWDTWLEQPTREEMLAQIKLLENGKFKLGEREE